MALTVCLPVELCNKVDRVQGFGKAEFRVLSVVPGAANVTIRIRLNQRRLFLTDGT